MPNNAKIQLIGNLTRDPETRDVKGNNVTSMSVAVNTNVRNEDGSFKSDFYDVSVWGKLGEYLMQRLQKGSMIWVTGSLTTGEYTGRDGLQHTALRVQADDVRGISRLKESGAPVQQRSAGRAAPRAAAVVEDDAIPF